MIRGMVSTWRHVHHATFPQQVSLYRRLSLWRTQSCDPEEFHIDIPVEDPSRQPRLPLCERPAVWTSTQEDVCSWYREALDTLCVVGDSLHVDGGPLRKDLELELQWVMEDAVVGWRNGDISSRAKDDDVVSMRLPLSELGALYVSVVYILRRSFYGGLIRRGIGYYCVLFV